MLFRISVFFRVRIAKEWFLYFVLGVHYTTQLFHAWEIVLHFVSEVMGIGNFLVSPVLPLLGFRKELLDPMHGDFSKSFCIVLCQLTRPWGVPVL